MYLKNRGVARFFPSGLNYLWHCLQYHPLLVVVPNLRFASIAKTGPTPLDARILSK